MESNKNTESWSRIQAQSLITEYKKYPCLYNPVDINFLNKSVHSEKLNTILDVLKTIKPLVTIEEIKRKIKSLKSQLFKEWQKILISKRSGVGVEDVYKPTLWCYDQLSFLININDAESSKSNIDLSGIGIEESTSRSFVEAEASELEDRGNSSQKKRKSKAHSMEMYVIEAMQFMKNYFANRPKKQQKEVVQREEEFCRYRCSLLKKNKLEENFERLTLEIIIIANQKINEGRKWLQKNNCVSPISTSTSSLPPYSAKNSSSSRDYINTPSALSYQHSNFPQTIDETSNFEPTSTSIPIRTQNKPISITSRPTSENRINCSTYIEEPIHFEPWPLSSTSTPIKNFQEYQYLPVTSTFNLSRSSSSTPTHSTKSGSLQNKKSKPLFILSHSQTSDSTSKYSVNKPSSSALPKLTVSSIYSYDSNHIPISKQMQSQSTKPIILEQILIKNSIPKEKNTLELALDGVFEHIIVEDSEIIL